MSSKDSQIVKKSQRVKIINQCKNSTIINKQSINQKSIVYSRTKNTIETSHTQPVSNFVSRRELNLNS